MGSQDFNSKKNLLDIISKSEELKRTMDSDGWKNIVQPLLDKMIMDCVGFKKTNGEWCPGAYVNFDHDPVEISNMFAYRQGLIELNNRLMSHFTAATQAVKIMQNKDKEKKYTMPMKDSRYSGYEGGTLG